MIGLWNYYDLQSRQETDGRPILSGTLLKYGDLCQLPHFQERIEAGAFGDVSQLDLRANLMHQRHMPLGRTGTDKCVVTGDDKGIYLERLELPNTTAGHDTAELVADGTLRGLSIEFKRGRTRPDIQNRILTVVTGTMSGFAVGDKPAYPESTVELRLEDFIEKEERRRWL